MSDQKQQAPTPQEQILNRLDAIDKRLDGMDNSKPSIEKMFMGLITSKKFVAAFASLGVALAAHFGFKLDPETIITILSGPMAYIVSQGVADHGKERAKAEAQSKGSNLPQSPKA